MRSKQAVRSGRSNGIIAVDEPNTISNNIDDRILNTEAERKEKEKEKKRDSKKWLKEHGEELEMKKEEKKRKEEDLSEEAKEWRRLKQEKKWTKKQGKTEHTQSEELFQKECSKLTVPKLLDSNNEHSVMAILNFDGGCRTWPRIAGAGAYLRVVKTSSMVATPDIAFHKVRWYSDEAMDSMTAEYNGLLTGLQVLHSLLQEFWQAIRRDDTDASSSSTVRIHVYGDAQTIIENMKENNAVRKDQNFEAIHASCMDIVRAIQNDHVEIKFQHIYRRHNQVADGTFLHLLLFMVLHILIR